MRWPRFELGLGPWQGPVIPLHHQRATFLQSAEMDIRLPNRWRNRRAACQYIACALRVTRIRYRRQQCVLGLPGAEADVLADDGPIRLDHAGGGHTPRTLGATEPGELDVTGLGDAPLRDGPSSASDHTNRWFHIRGAKLRDSKWSRAAGDAARTRPNADPCERNPPRTRSGSFLPWQ